MSTAEGQGAAPTGSPSCQGAIAVVGLACRFPGDAADINGLWQMMEDGKSAWTKIPESRMNVRGYYHPDPSRQGSVSHDARPSSSLLLFRAHCSHGVLYSFTFVEHTFCRMILQNLMQE